MSTISTTLAKVGALQKAFEQIPYNREGQITKYSIKSLLESFWIITNEVKVLIPELYSDLPTPTPHSENQTIFLKHQLALYTNTLSYIMDLWARHKANDNHVIVKNITNQIFITHGGDSEEWRSLQLYIEKTLKIPTIELAQKYNGGATVIEKLEREAENCNTAIIVMTHGNTLESSSLVRENVMHEIGFFQGKYGRKRVILMHEEGVNIPSNLAGIVYIPFPKDTIYAAFGALVTELSGLEHLNLKN